MQIKFDPILGKLREADGGSSYVLPQATTSILGGVKIDGTTITINNGVISSTGGSSFSPVNTLYVAKNGNDSNNGAFNTPFLTIQAAINAATPSNSARTLISIFPGTYNEQLTLKPNIALNGNDLNTVIVEYDAGDAVTIPVGTSYESISIDNILINNAGIGRGLVINTGASVELNNISASGNDSEGCVITGNSFNIAMNGCSFVSNQKSGFVATGGSTAYLQDCSFYGNAPSFYDLEVDAGSTVILGANNFYQNNNPNFAGSVVYINKASQIGNDSSVTGVTIKDALNTLLASSSSLTINRDSFYSIIDNQAIFTLSHIPAILNSEVVNLNGQIMQGGVDSDYTISGNTITFNYGLLSSDRLQITYI